VVSYTGYTFEQLLCGTAAQKELMRSIDVLIDGPFIQAEKKPGDRLSGQPQPADTECSPKPCPRQSRVGNIPPLEWRILNSKGESVTLP